MNDRVTQPLIATPDGEAELALVVRLSWEDVAALGQEAGRLSASMQRPVTLDEAVSHRLRSRQAGSHARPQQAPPMPPSAVSAPAVSTVSSLPRSPGEQARQAIEKINGNGSAQGA
ncbi:MULTISPECIES: hypothetical protein [Streptomyces]|jgi:hypothetical protein|uniref:Uncharacterized protein n=1 Tax=Streptomyces phaeochromogenes TaxID=1923 RepID=A0ABZ1H9B3_STRPH|nr:MULTISPECIES: hypothetical protein [Streptomyces]MCX5600864.1 hypothetical protein [Streptomyces phaeochromogenes]MCZ4513078.1 hypothetical protein [Streptomyces sp. ActVer]WRZ28583.1 hypothetical protein OG931_12845 [Streptomyces phaeochromogenes]WSD14162.1 hypothetical protein OHB35_13400 [Streptomyces phaeochromogenes]WSJ08898.1 hypothetical protein OG437_37390 [Streptomyces phaeochromogenes]